MIDIQLRLFRCFQAVFPHLAPEDIHAAHQESTEGWDSIATATLFALIQDEFEFELSTDELQNLDSFGSIAEFLLRQTKTNI